MQENKECYFCKATRNLHEHHIFFGTANRKKSEKHGMKVYLCQEHHTGNAGVHKVRMMDMALKIRGQLAFEKYYLGKVEDPRDYFYEEFGKYYVGKDRKHEEQLLQTE